MIYSIPWFFFGNKIFFRSFKRKLSYKTIIYITFYPFSFIRKFINLLINFKKLKDIDKFLLIKACCFNSFKISELFCYKRIGVKDWRILSEFVPNTLSGQYLTYKRSFLNYSCNDAIDLLNDKRKIHLLTPINWRPPFHYSRKKLYETNSYPSWWKKSLGTTGLIIKPNESSSGKGVIRLFWDGDNILFSTIQRPNKYFIKTKINNLPTLTEIKTVWRNHFKQNSDLIIMPYLQNKKNFPISNSTVVFRVITEQGNVQTSIASAWIELPINQNKIVIFSLGGDYLPLLHNLNVKEKQVISNWSNFLLNNKIKGIYLKIFDASIVMHEKLPKIDTVAWDWVIGDKNYFLLEGNSLYGLMAPQILNFLNYEV